MAAVLPPSGDGAAPEAGPEAIVAGLVDRARASDGRL